MKKITDFLIETHLKHAVGKLTPELAEQIWEQPTEKAAGGEWYLDGIAPAKHSYRKAVKWIAAAAACLCVCLLSFCMINLRVDATIYLDVNPGIALRINRSEKVLDAEALNEDGRIILEDMDLKNTDLDVAVNAILGSMIKHGYVSEAKDAVLLSVEGGSAQKTKDLRSRLSENIYAYLFSVIGSGKVFDQDLENDDALEALVKQYGITPGKAALLQRLADANPNLDYCELAGMPMNELVAYLSQSGIDLRDFADYTGDDFDFETDEDTDDQDSDMDDGEEDLDDSGEAAKENAADDGAADADADYEESAADSEDEGDAADTDGEDAGNTDANAGTTADSDADGDAAYMDTDDADTDDADADDDESGDDGQETEEDD